MRCNADAVRFLALRLHMDFTLSAWQDGMDCIFQPIANAMRLPYRHRMRHSQITRTESDIQPRVEANWRYGS